MASEDLRSQVKALRPTALAVIAAALAQVPAQGDDPRFTDELVVTSLVQPTDVAVAADGSFYVSEKRGLIKYFAGPGAPAETVVDIRTEVHNYVDRGLISIVLAPDFPADPWLYLAFTYDAPIGETAPFWGQVGANTDPCPTPPGGNAAGCVVRGRLARVNVEPDEKLREKRVLLGEDLEVLADDRWCNQFPSHSMAGMTFGPDGALYVGAGDGAAFVTADWGQLGQEYWKGPACGDPADEGGALRAQDLRTSADPSSWDGAIVRLDPETGLPLPDNPLVGVGPADNDAVVAFGLRNPFRLAFDPIDDSLWIADVGWRTTEEVNRIVDPLDSVIENFGWPCREGLEAVSDYSAVPLCVSFPAGDVGTALDPVWAWDRRVADADGCGLLNGSRALSGVAFATAASYPSERRSLWVADVISGCIWSMPRGVGGVPDPDARELVFEAASSVSLRSAPDGSIWRVDLFGGQVRRLVVAALFADGFESGDLGEWSAAQP